MYSPCGAVKASVLRYDQANFRGQKNLEGRLTKSFFRSHGQKQSKKNSQSKSQPTSPFFVLSCNMMALFRSGKGLHAFVYVQNLVPEQENSLRPLCLFSENSDRGNGLAARHACVCVGHAGENWFFLENMFFVVAFSSFYKKDGFYVCGICICSFEKPILGNACNKIRATRRHNDSSACTFVSMQGTWPSSPSLAISKWKSRCSEANVFASFVDAIRTKTPLSCSALSIADMSPKGDERGCWPGRTT